MQQHNNKYSADMPGIGIRRREFIAGLSNAAGGVALLSIPSIVNATTVFPAEAAVTVGDIMDLFIKQVPGAPFSNTVDTLKAGTRDIKVTGVVTTMFATIA